MAADYRKDFEQIIESAKPKDTNSARKAVRGIIQDKATRQQIMLLAIAEQQVQALADVMQAGNKLSSDISATIGDELQYYTVDEKTKILRTIMSTAASLTASAEVVKGLVDTLAHFEKSLENQADYNLSSQQVETARLLIQKLRLEFMAKAE